MARWNYTLNITELFEEEVTNIQYISAAFSGFSILPNILTICLLMRSKLSSLAEYSIIISWCMLNIAYILNFIYLYLIPNDKIVDEYYIFSYYSSSVILASISMLVTLLNIEYTLQSQTLYKYLLLLIWLITIVFLMLLYTSFFTDLGFDFVTSWIVYLELITLAFLALVFVLNLFVLTLHSEKYTNFKARIILSMVFLLSYGLRWSVGSEYLDDYYTLLLTMTSTLLFYSNGLINFMVLVCFDTDIKHYFVLKEDKSEIAKDVEF